MLILDEPTLGIDPVQLVETRELIRQQSQGQTVLLSTHMLSEAAELCTRVLVMYEGRLVAEDSPKQLAAAISRPGQIELRVAGPHEPVVRALRGIAAVSSVTWETGSEVDRYVVDSRGGADVRTEAVRTIIDHGWRMLSMAETEFNLEEAFLGLIRDRAATAGTRENDDR